jgi:hemerythrin-like metal-binding protein
MEKIVWNNDYCTGIPEIDSQHIKIIDQINYLIDNHNCKAKASLNQEIILFLDKYGAEHFSTEEGFLRKINYPDLDNHIKMHQEFKLRTVKSAVKVLKGQEDVSEETISFLKNWWTDHILKADMEFKNFILNS